MQSSGNQVPEGIVTGPAVWPAFRRALGRVKGTGRTDDGIGVHADAVAALDRWVHDSLSGAGQPADLPIAPADVGDLTDSVRRYFVEELRGEPSADTVGAVHVFSALASGRRVAPPPSSDTAAAVAAEGSTALNLAVEVAHDMRSPLAGILFLGDMLRTGRSGVLNELQRQQLGMIYAAAFRLSQMACDLIDFVHQGRDIIDDAPTAFSLSELLWGVTDLLLPVAEEKGIALDVVLNARIVRVGARAALSRVLLNLASNAINHSTANRVTITVRDVTATRVELSVENTGGDATSTDGAADDLPQLIDPYRARGHTGRAFSSSGLGLAVCHRLVTALGSELRVSSSAEGTRFWFEVELPPADDAEHAAAADRADHSPPGIR